ncbi:hypothetical protein [Haliangium sp.]|uniref:hypothetical protein n=1 Tax=Haliangium sp. TaxID=2663208 RepID=UPI003D12964A
MRASGMLYLSLAALLASCGGSQSPAQAQSMGDSHAGTNTSEDGAGTASDMSADPTGPETGDDAMAETPTEDPPPVTFRLINQAEEELVFSIEKGWQTIFIAYSGQPPNAKPIILFPKWCTASCDLAAAERCPVCEEPETVKEVMAAEQRQVVAPGESFDLAWDGQVYVYEQTRGQGRQRCECSRTEPVAPETYTVRACGLRLTKVASKSTKLQCADATLTMPSEQPQVVELEFPAP